MSNEPIRPIPPHLDQAVIASHDGRFLLSQGELWRIHQDFYDPFLTEMVNGLRSFLHQPMTGLLLDEINRYLGESFQTRFCSFFDPDYIFVEQMHSLLRLRATRGGNHSVNVMSVLLEAKNPLFRFCVPDDDPRAYKHPSDVAHLSLTFDEDNHHSVRDMLKRWQDIVYPPRPNRDSPEGKVIETFWKELLPPSKDE